jgi:pimeloyl-ACP methyl ester carboxylesterase
MLRILGTVLISIALLAMSCSTEKQKIEYGSNNGRHITILNTKIYYEEYGQGTPLILLQGAMGSIKDFEKCIPELSKKYRVIAPDTPGQGRSELADSMSYQLLTEYMSQLIDSLKIDSTYIMGWSDGGIVGILLAEKRPDKVKRVVATGANYKLDGAILPEISPTPMPMAMFETQNKAWIDNYLKALPRDWKKFKTDIDKMTFQKQYFPATVFENIHIPVLFVMGDKDMILLEHGIEMHRLTKNSQFCVLPNTTHAVFEERPDLINKIAMDFFQK